MKELNAKYSAQISTEHIYLEEKPELAKKYNIRYVPTLLFKDAQGKIVAQEIGYRSVDEIIDVFRKTGITF